MDSFIFIQSFIPGHTKNVDWQHPKMTVRKSFTPVLLGASSNLAMYVYCMIDFPQTKQSYCIFRVRIQRSKGTSCCCCSHNNFTQSQPHPPYSTDRDSCLNISYIIQCRKNACLGKNRTWPWSAVIWITKSKPLPLNSKNSGKMLERYVFSCYLLSLLSLFFVVFVVICVSCLDVCFGSCISLHHSLHFIHSSTTSTSTYTGTRTESLAH
jgi:hypothetical protein